MSEQTQEEFWKDWERIYQAFKGRWKAEGKESESDNSCRCPHPHKKTGDYYDWCDHLDGFDHICTHPLNKPPEPKCEHGCSGVETGIFVSYKDFGDVYCRRCGVKL